MKVQIAWSRIAYGVLTLGASLLIAIVAQPLVRKRPDAIEMIATVFSILAGFLVAVITLVSDTIELKMQNWEQDYRIAQSVRARLLRHEWTFYLYLIVLGLGFVVMLFAKSKDPLRYWLEFSLLTCASWAFLLSFRLPRELSSRQIKKLEQAIDEWRKKDGTNT